MRIFGWGYSAGGAGNPGQANYDNGSSSIHGQDGTGGLLIIIAKSIINNGSIVSNGSNGGLGPYPGGGSGGGSIQLFYRDKFKQGNISVAGGGPGIFCNKGGNGSFRAQQKISNLL
jgi:hypothetical protein